MGTPRKFWFTLVGAILAMTVIACSCGTLIPTPTSPTSPPPATVPPPQGGNPLPELEGYWQFSNKAFAITWQNDQYVVTSVIDSETGSLDITSQSWDGSALTWTYYRATSDRSITYTTSAVSGDKLVVNYSYSTGGSGSETLHRISSAQPAYENLPYYDDFSDPTSGWDIWEEAEGSAGYANGAYYLVSQSNGYYAIGYPFMFFGDIVLDVDATVVNGPGNNNFSYEVSCRVRNNGGGYSFEIGADGTYAVGVYTDGDTYTSLLSGDDWQASSAINQGLASNHLTVTCAGSLLKFEVNGQVVFEGQDTTYADGDIGLSVVTYDENNSPAEVHFSNLAVRAP